MRLLNIKAYFTEIEELANATILDGIERLCKWNHPVSANSGYAESIPNEWGERINAIRVVI